MEQATIQLPDQPEHQGKEATVEVEEEGNVPPPQQVAPNQDPP